MFSTTSRRQPVEDHQVMPQNWGPMTMGNSDSNIVTANKLSQTGVVEKQKIRQNCAALKKTHPV